MLSTYLTGVITLTSLCHCWEKVGASLQGLGGLRGLLGAYGFVPPVQRAQSLLCFDASTKGKGLKWGTLNLEHCGQGQQMSQSSRGILMAEHY